MGKRSMVTIVIALVGWVLWAAPGAASFWRLAAILGLNMVFLAGLRVVTGLSRLVSLVHFAVIGVGAYVAAIVAIQSGTFGAGALLAGTIAGAGVSVVVGIVSARSADHYYAFVTLAASEVLTNLFRGLKATGGSNGLAALPAIHVFGTSLVRPDQYFWICCAGAIVALTVAGAYETSSFGLALRAAGDEGRRVECLGVRETPLRLISFCVGGCLAGLGGALLAGVDRFVGPESFGGQNSITLLCLLVIGGGLTQLRGVVLAAIFASFGLEALRPLGPWQMIVVSALAFVLLIRSNG